MKRHAPGYLAVFLIAATAMLFVSPARSRRNQRPHQVLLHRFQLGGRRPEWISRAGHFCPGRPRGPLSIVQGSWGERDPDLLRELQRLRVVSGKRRGARAAGPEARLPKQITELAHKDGVKVMGYFCVGANTYWGQKHPDQSYGIPSAIHIPFTSDYLDYLAGSSKTP